MAKLFFSYSHRDEGLRDDLEVHLSMLKRQGLIDAFHDRRITAGEVLEGAISAHLEAADVILCLLSPDFIASDYCYSREMARGIERHNSGEARVIPVILRHCEWQQTPLKGLLATPTDGKPVRAWADQDEALNIVTTEIRSAVETLSRGNTAALTTLIPKAFAPSSAAIAVVSERPRSANLHVPRAITDKDRDDYLESAFEFVAEHFANSLRELAERHDSISGRVSRLDANRFTAAAYRDGRKVSAITVYTGGGFGGQGISFSLNDNGETNRSNGSFQLPSRGDTLAFKSLFGHATGSDATLNYEEVAEAIWASFMEPLQRQR
jgi:hypothetical protein